MSCRRGGQTVTHRYHVIMYFPGSRNSVVLFLACCVALSSGEWRINKGPRHTAVRLNTEAEMTCNLVGTNTSHGEYFQWAWRKENKDWEIIFDTRRPHNIKSGYRIFGKYSLTVLNVTKQRTGKYLAALRRPSGVNDERQADLIAVDEMSCHKPFTEISEYETANLTCEAVIYTRGSIYHPTLKWRNSLGDYLPTWNSSVTHWDRIEARSITQFTALAKHDGIPFTCDLLFPGDASRPTYTERCIISFMVLYPVRNIAFKPNPDDFPNRHITVELGDHIECRAEGSTPISYRWQRIKGSGPSFVSGPTIRVTTHTINVYLCKASNVIHGRLYTTTANVSFSAKPKVTFSPLKKIYTLSDRVRCLSSGVVLPVYRWERIFGLGPKIIHGSMLSFYEEQYSSNTTYECIAEGKTKPYAVARGSITFDVEGFSGSVTLAPRNVVAVSGSNIRFSFRAEGMNHFNESMMTAFSTARYEAPPRVISIDSRILHREGTEKYMAWCNASSYYRRVDLSISNASSTDVGVYSLFMTGGLVNRYAFLIALESYPKCNMMRTPEVGEVIVLGCEVFFHSPHKELWVPRMKWYYSGFTPQQSTWFNSTYIINTARFNVSVRDHLQSIRCETTYNPPPSFIERFYFDKRAPDFRHFCYTQIHVYYSARNVTIKPDARPGNSTINIKLGSYLKCNAIGNPEPSFAWYRKEGNGPGYVIKKDLLVTKDMIQGINRYTCVAQNRIKEKLHDATKDISFYVV